MAEAAIATGSVKSSDDAKATSKENVFRSKSYEENFFKSLRQLRDDSVYCDVQLKVEDQTFPCHKVILMAGSTYFHAMFVSDMCEHDRKDIVVGGVNKEIFSCILDFFYSGEIEVNEENCEDLLIAADMLSVTEIINACCEFLKNKLQPENCVGIYLFAEAVCCKKLKTDAEVYIHRNFLKVIHEEEFFSVTKETLINFLYSEFLHVENEYQVFKGAMDWILHDSHNRKKYIFDVMAPVRFPIISEAHMNKYITALTDTDLSIKVALQKILSDFKLDKGIPWKIIQKYQHAKTFQLMPRKCSRKSIYICGGFTRPKGGRWTDATTLNTVERYDTFYKTWHECPGFEYHRSALGAGVIDRKVCVVGGENDMLILDTVETYDPVTSEWSSLRGMNLPRCGLGVCTLDNCLYAVGGWVGSEIGGTIEKYDYDERKSDERRWFVIAHCRSLKCWIGVTADNGLLYLVGGSNDLGDELTSVESFNPVTLEWTTLPDLNIKRSYTAVAVLDDCLYAAGGWNEWDGALSSVEKLDFNKGYWVHVAPMLEVRAGASMVVVNNMLYVMGGRSYKDEFTAPSTLDTMEGYDPHTDTWTQLGTMLSSRCEAAAVIM